MKIRKKENRGRTKRKKKREMMEVEGRRRLKKIKYRMKRKIMR